MVPKSSRVAQLDVLRAFAIVLVLLQHYGGSEHPWLPWERLHRIGWTGVDLFFVLSGFLVSGLLFREQDRYGDVKPGLFLIRRGYKIYPMFWIMIAVTAILRPLYHMGLPWRALVCELLFIQNYGSNLWVPTWSLAVEEHFYLLVALAFWWWDRRRPRWSERQGLTLAICGLGAVFALRMLTVILFPQAYKLVNWGTHLRIDSLGFGALLSFLYQRHRSRLGAFVRRWRWALGVGGALCVSHVFFIKAGTFFGRTFGYTLLYLGYGAILLVTLFCFRGQGAVSQALAKIGRASYGIYLWHLPVYILLVDKLVGIHVLPKEPTKWLPVYLTVCIGSGMLLTRWIETPFLRLRDERFPPRAPLPMAQADAPKQQQPQHKAQALA